MSFDRELWLKGDDRTRGMMVDDLIDGEVLKAMDIKKVQEYLGPSLHGDRETLAYEVAIKSIFMDEPELHTMVVFFDRETGEVKRVRVTD